MGVKGLWTVLEPAGKKIPLGELSGKVLAIDLSCWVCSSQILPNHVQKPHLRNLFFKTACLLDNDILPVFVLEGDAPELKRGTMQKRLELRFQSSDSKTKHSISRKNYKTIEKECIQLLTAMGVPFIRSSGEAEAMCAALNKVGIADGCVTEDGDAFLYGAKTIYRQLSIDPSSFNCTEYRMDSVRSILNLSREKLIVMAVLVGCDYLPEGLPSVGKETTIKLLNGWQNVEAVDRLKSWLNDCCHSFEIPQRPPHCSHCKHPGLLRSHTKNGCVYCKTTQGCNNTDNANNCQCEWHSNENTYLEKSIRTKIKEIPAEVIHEIIKEFLTGAEQEMPRKFVWEMPEIEPLLKTLQIKLNWKEDYAANKAIPLITRWAVKNPKNVGKIPLKACKIIKKKVQRGKPLYVIEWSGVKDFGQLENVYETTEPRHLIEKHFPELVESFGGKTSKKKITKRSETSSKVKGQRDITEMLQTMNLKATQESSDSDLSVIIESEKTTKRSETTKVKGQRDITEMLRTMNLKASGESSDSDSDLSIIIETICNRKTAPTTRLDPTAETDLNTQRNTFLNSRVNHSTPAVVLELGDTPKANLAPDTSSDTARRDSATPSRPLLSGRVNSNLPALVLELGDPHEPSFTPDTSFDTARWDSASPSKPHFSGRVSSSPPALVPGLGDTPTANFNPDTSSDTARWDSASPSKPHFSDRVSSSPPALVLGLGDTPTANLNPDTSSDTARWDSATPSKPLLSGKVSGSPPALVLELGDTPKPNFNLDLSFDTAAERDCNTPTESLLSHRVNSSPPGITVELGDTPKPNFNLDVSFDTTAEWDCNSLVKTPVNNRITNKPDFDEFDFSTPLPLNERIKLRL